MAEQPCSWRAEMYGDESGQDPFWVSVEDEHGHDRDAVEAAELVKGFVGRESFATGFTVELIRGRVEDCGVEGWRFTKDSDGDEEFWEVCCS